MASGLETCSQHLLEQGDSDWFVAMLYKLQIHAYLVNKNHGNLFNFIVK